MPLTLPDLPYAYNALEPFIDEATMKLHHDKHHATYLQKYVDGLKGSEFENVPVEQVVAALDKVPANLRGIARNHGGGYLNHNLFWVTMGPKAGGAPSGKLGDALASTFGGFDTFKTQFTAAATGVFGSGWAWLVVKADGKLAITATPNQDTPLSTGDSPVLALDVWEHAYYLKYQNRRPEYIAAWWNVVNWSVVAEKFAAVSKG